MNKSVRRNRPHLQPPYATNQAATASGNPSHSVPAPREDPPFVRQSEQEENDIKDLINAEDYYKRYELGPILHARLVAMRLIPNSNDYDMKKLLGILIREIKRKNMAILPKPLSSSQIRKLQKVRNEIDHNNWFAIQKKHPSHFNSMITLATSLANVHVAGQITAGQNRIVVHKDFTGGVTFRPFTFPQNGTFNMNAALGLSQMTARLFNKIVIPCTSEFQLTYRSPGSPPPSADLYANVLEMIDKKIADLTFLPLPGALHILQSVKSTRLNVAHGEHTILLRDFEAKYDDLVEYLRLIDHPDEADIVEAIKDKLLELKNSGQEVSSSSFPMLYSS